MNREAFVAAIFTLLEIKILTQIGFQPKEKIFSFHFDTLCVRAND